MQKTCCQRAEILVTSGDVARIRAHTQLKDFWELRAPADPAYLDDDADDPNWKRGTVRPDGLRRVLKRRTDGDCGFLGANGCILPEDVRPIVCRLYPWTYNERGLTEEDSEYCPVGTLAPNGGSMLKVLAMDPSRGEAWRAQLYDELRRGMGVAMKVGLTYDLRDDYLAEGYPPDQVAEFDRADTIDALEAAIRAAGHETERIGSGFRLVERLAQGHRWDMVFNIAEGLRGYGRESMVPALLDAYDIPYTFSDPLVCALTLHKGMAKRALRDAGIPTPANAIVERLEDISSVNLPYPLFAKPVAEGSSKGVASTSRVTTAAELDRECRHLLERYRQPVLVETFLPGKEFTVGVLGTGPEARVAAVLEVTLLAGADPDIYTYDNKEECETKVRYSLATGPLADEARELALATWRTLGCRDAGRVDVRADASGRLNVMEVNALPGLHPEHSDLPIMCSLAGISYDALIAGILESACRRRTAQQRKQPSCVS